MKKYQTEVKLEVVENCEDPARWSNFWGSVQTRSSSIPTDLWFPGILWSGMLLASLVRMRTAASVRATPSSHQIKCHIDNHVFLAADHFSTRHFHQNRSCVDAVDFGCTLGMPEKA